MADTLLLFLCITSCNPSAASCAMQGPISWATLALTIGAGAAAVVYNNVVKEKKRSECTCSSV